MPNGESNGMLDSLGGDPIRKHHNVRKRRGIRHADKTCENATYITKRRRRQRKRNNTSAEEQELFCAVNAPAASRPSPYAETPQTIQAHIAKQREREKTPNIKLIGGEIATTPYSKSGTTRPRTERGKILFFIFVFWL